VGTTTTTSRRCIFAKQIQRKASQKRRCSYVAIVVPAGYGGTHAAASDSDAKGRALNRLVEVKVWSTRDCKKVQSKQVHCLEAHRSRLFWLAGNRIVRILPDARDWSQASGTTSDSTEFIPRNGWAQLLFAWLFIARAPTCQSSLALWRSGTGSRHRPDPTLGLISTTWSAPCYSVFGSSGAPNQYECKCRMKRSDAR
jgi:hypothetical protein